MSAEAPHRKLAAIMFTDMVGYSALAQRDDELALELLEEHRLLLREIFPRFHGSEIKTIGDGFLVEFHSALEAVQCAVEIQRALSKRNDDVPLERRVEIRVGVHIGDVVHRNGDVYGDGVNIASRIERLAGAGGICVSMDVERQIRSTLEVRLEKLAPTELKNISIPMDLFRIILPWEKRAPIVVQSETKSTPASRKFLATAVALFFLLMIGVGWWWSDRPRRTPTSPAATTASSAAAEIPAKSIAVLPFENLSRDPDNAFFADGVQDEILTDLAKIADLKVISRTSVMQYKKRAARNLPEIAQALKVAHVLEGGVQRSANRVRVSAQLIDARNDTHIWAEKYDRDLSDIFAIQSEIAQAIADQLQAKISPREKSAINERPTSDPAAHDLYLRAKELRYDGEVNPSRQRENLFEEVRLLEQALARDPAFLLAHCQLAAAHDLIYFFNYDHTDSRLKLAEASIGNAVRLRPNAGETHLAQAIHFYWGYLNYDRAREALTKAQQSLPNDAQVFKFLGLIDQRQGRWNEAVRNLERVVELDPRNIDGIGNLAQTYFNVRKYEASVAMFDRIAELEPQNPAARTFRASIKFEALAEMAPLRAVLNTIEAEGPASAAEVAPLSFELALDERDPVAATRALANIPHEGYTDSNSRPFPHAWCEGLVARLRQDAPTAHSAFTVARSEAENIVRAQPGNAKPLSVLALIDARLGQKEKAIQEARAACDLLPIAKDAVDGALLLTNLAVVYALTGEQDLALKELDRLRKIPCGPSYGDLRLNPVWDAIRGDPRFEKIVVSLAPRHALPERK